LRAQDKIPPRGWRNTALTVWRKLDQDNVSIIAAGVAFYSLLALFPGMGALVAIYGLAADPVDLERQLDLLSNILPAEGLRIVRTQMHAIVSQPDTGLSWGVILGFGLTLWSATAGVKTLMTALNIVYGCRERRGFLRFNATSIVLTLGTVIAAAFAIIFILILPAVLGILDRFGWIDRAVKLLLSVAHWPIMTVLVILGFQVMYYFGPSHETLRWRWISRGAVIAAALWLVASALFSFYAAHIADYNETYGSLGAVVILLMWLYITAYVVLLGAEIDATAGSHVREEGAEPPVSA
jgi:membrane protein